MPTEYGSPIYAGHRPKADAALVALIRRAGGIVHRQDRDHRVRPSRSGQDPQPAQSRAHAGRLVVGLGRGRRRGLRADRHRQPDRRLGDPAGELLRRRGLQAVLSAAADRRHEMRVLASRHRRPVRGRASPTWPMPPPSSATATCGSIGRTPASPRIAVLREQPWPSASRRHGGCARDRGAGGLGRAWRAVKDVQLPPVVAAAFRAHATIHGYEAARSLAFEYDRHREQLGKSLRDLIDGADGDHAPTPMTTPGAPPARRAARWPS